MTVRASIPTTSRERAAAEFVRFAAALEASEKKLWMSKSPLRRGQLVLAYGDLADGGPREGGSWVGFVDLGPSLNWSHDCVYWFMDADGSTRHARAEWCPERWREIFAEFTP